MAIERLQICKCGVCGIIAEVLDGGAGEMVCCGEPMMVLKESTTEGPKEKHVPVIEEVDGGVMVKVGSVTHPMEDKHFIEWIEVLAGSKAYREFLQPGMAPEAFFPVKAAEITKTREYCNVHGLWKAE